TALGRTERWRDGLRSGGGTRRGGAPLALRLKLGGHLLGRGLLRHGSLGGGTLGSGALGRGSFGHRLFRGALCGSAFRLRTVGLGATLRGTALRLGSLQRRALGGRLLRGGAKLLLCSSLFGRAPLLDRTIHRRALIGRPSFFLGASFGRGATGFLGASFVFRSALDGRTLFG